MKKNLAALFLLVILSISMTPVANAQCAMCKAVAASNLDSKQNDIGKGINNGVLYLMAVPYVFVGASVLILRYRKRQKAIAEAASNT